MGKLPAFQFYPGDWQKDPSLRRCSKAAKGVWMDMMCLLFECPVRGVFVDAGGRPWGDEEIAAAIGGDIAANLECITELVAKGVVRRDARGAIFSRRMVRDQEKRQADKERKRKQRSDFTAIASSPERKGGREDEVQSQLFKETGLENDGLRSAIDQIAHLHPANDHLKDKAIPQAQRAVVGEAVARDGVDLVLSGTRSLAEGVAQWEPSDRRFIPNPVRFYQEAGYLKRPETWQRSRKRNGTERCGHHPNAGFTDWGECWGCYGNKYVSGCQPA